MTAHDNAVVQIKNDKYSKRLHRRDQRQFTARTRRHVERDTQELAGLDGPAQPPSKEWAIPTPATAVGRVGALALALGIGAAMLAMPGLAAADPEGSGGARGSTTKSESGASTPRASVRGTAETARAPGARPRKSETREQQAPPAAASRANGPSAAAARSRPTPPAPIVPATSPTPSEAPSAPWVPSAPSSGNGGAATVVTSASRGALAPLSPARVATRAIPALAPAVQMIDARNQAAVRKVFHALINWTATLPVNSVTSWLEGGLLMLRRSLFNQTAGVHSVQTANSPTLVSGKIDVVDPEGDGWDVELVSGPSHGSVVLGATSQADGIGSTKYTYVPGAGYGGDDQFVVKITPTVATFNILHPFGVLDTRYYTVAVGDAAEGRFNAEGADPKDVPDTHLYLANAAATVTVTKRGLINPRYAVTVTLPAETAAKSFSWMDSRGNLGSIPVDTMLAQDWAAYSKKAAENAVKPLLTFKYSDQGLEKAVFVDVGEVTKNADGSYTITGDLKDGAPAQEGRVDTWDFAGHRYKTAYDHFLDGAGLKDCKSGQVCTTVSAVGVLGTTTLSPSAFSENGGHDYPQPTPGDASATQTNLGSMGPGTTGVGQGNGTAITGNTGFADLELTAMIPWGDDGSFIAATNLSQADTAAEGSGIFLFTAQAPNGGTPTWTKTQLVDNTWNAAVNVMTAYDQILTDSTGKPIPTTYTATPVTGTSTALTLAVTGGINPSSLIGQTITGKGIKPGTTINGFISSDVTGVTYSISNPISGTDPSFAVTLPDKPTVQPGLVVGLSDGSVYYWNGTTCTHATCVGPVVNGGAELGGLATPDYPLSLAMAPNGTIYAVGHDTWVIDTAKNEIITTLPLSWGSNSFPDVVVSPDGFRAYATTGVSTFSAGVAVIDTSSNEIITTIVLPNDVSANAVAISPDGTYGYVVNSGYASQYSLPPSVVRFDATTNTLVSGVNILLPGGDNIQNGDYGRAGVAFSADGASLYVSDAFSGLIHVIDTASNTLLSQTIDVGGSPGAMALTPDGGHLFVTQTPNNGNSISVIDTSTNTVSTTITVGNGPAEVVFNPHPGLPYAYVANSNDDTVSVIDLPTMSVIGTFSTGVGNENTLGLAVTHDGLHLYAANLAGGEGNNGTVVSFQVSTPVASGWAQLMPSNTDGIGINAIAELPNNLGFVIGNTDGFLATWNNPILVDGVIVPGPGANLGCSNGSSFSCWTVAPNNPMTSINAILPSGQTGGFVAIGTNGDYGWAQGFNGADTFEGGTTWNEIPTTLLPYDGVTLVGSIGSSPVIAESGVISAPSYASQLPDLSASSTGCNGSYNSGSGAGCAGYVLTVQQAAGNSILPGQTLYGGPGLTPETVITEQISDGDGKLCSISCTVGGTGVYLVNTSQVVAPGTPMSASAGSGFILGFNDGSLHGWNNDIAQLVAPGTWNSPVNTMVPWRDGFVVGLNDGSVMYWSPSNNPVGNSGPYVPLNGISMALDYPGSTIPSQIAQPPGWSQLQGWTSECDCLGWGGQAVTSMVQMGDGFAVGLTAPDGSTNGAVMLFTGFGALSNSSAFGYLQTTTTTQAGTTSTLQQLTPANGFTQIASDTAIPPPSGTVPAGSVQQMVPVNQLIKDSAGNWWNASSVVVGLTDNGIYSWSGANLTPDASTQWNQLQAPAQIPGQLTTDVLQSAWTFAANSPSGTFGHAGAIGGDGDPVFGQKFNQAACGTRCSGDFYPFVFNHPFGNGGTIYSLGTDIELELNLSAAGYGYMYVPANVWDKFEPDKYSAGLLLAVQGGPSVYLNPPDGGLYVQDTLTGGISYTDTQETEFGVFGETVGIDFSLTGSIGLSKQPLQNLQLAYAYYTPGLLLTWNTHGKPDGLFMSSSAFPSTGYVTPQGLLDYFDPTGDATLSATVTPYASVSYGLYTPPNSYFNLDIFKLTVEYKNPINADLTVPLIDPTNTTLSLSSQGILTAGAAFIPSITSDLSWKGKYKIYSVKDAAV